jgi:hypothetical protein
VTTEVLTLVLTAGVESTAGQGRIWYLKSATAPLTMVAQKLGTGAIVRRFVNVPAGFKFKAEPGSPGWDYLRITSASSQTIELIVGDDDVDVANAVSVTGSVTVQESPSDAITDIVPVAMATATVTQLIAANTSRRRVTITNPSTNAASIFIRRALAASNDLLELQPGTFAEFKTKAGLWGIQSSGGSQNALVFEET